jgi:signal peptidase I
VNKERIKAEMKDWAEAIIIALVIALVIRAFIVQAFKIPSSSMEPTLQIGDRLFVNKFIYGARIPLTDITFPALKEPQRGDIIVFRSQEPPKKDFIKRLVALGGETVGIRRGRIYINGKELTGPDSVTMRDYSNKGDYGAEGAVVKVPEGSYFMLGDNTDNSRDSRYWGFVPRKDIIGKAMCIYWPLYRIRIVK